MTFKDFNFHYSVLDGLDAMGFETPTPIQEKAIPCILNNQDLIACAQTGTGKTAAYLLPVLDKLMRQPNNHKSVNTIIIAPTRELVQQIDQQIEGFAYFLSVTSAPVYGGGSGGDFVREKNALKQGADIIVTTPGKFISHLNLGYVKVAQLRHLILDEADKMLDMGFYDDIMRIINALPKQNRQTLLFSATMPPKIRQLAKKILNKPEQINIALSQPAKGVKQSVYRIQDDLKVPLLKHLLKNKAYKSVIVFASTKNNVKRVAQNLKQSGFLVAPLHSDLAQTEREEMLRQFKNKRLQILVGTDILARGIDIKEVHLVVNYDMPRDAEDYVHRVGRTARADSKGVAITFVNGREKRKFQQVERLIKNKIPITPLPEHLAKLISSDSSGRNRKGNSSAKPRQQQNKKRKNYRKKPKNAGNKGGGQQPKKRPNKDK